MGDREDAKLAAWCAAAAPVPRNARPQSGGLAGAPPRGARRFAAAGGHSFRTLDCAARIHQSGNPRRFSGKMTRAADKLDGPMADLAEGQGRGEACNV
jgi:hypothetical protein